MYAPRDGSRCICVITGVSRESPQLILYIFLAAALCVLRTEQRVGVGIGTAVGGGCPRPDDSTAHLSAPHTPPQSRGEAAAKASPQGRLLSSQGVATPKVAVPHRGVKSLWQLPGQCLGCGAEEGGIEATGKGRGSQVVAAMNGGDITAASRVSAVRMNEAPLRLAHNRCRPDLVPGMNHAPINGSSMLRYFIHAVTHEIFPRRGICLPFTRGGMPVGPCRGLTLPPATGALLVKAKRQQTERREERQLAVTLDSTATTTRDLDAEVSKRVGVGEQ
ncbi:hypothetical protein E2C01_020162 [Portunus trituberculatus]|uniref:Uncharacterized protein n=1 Tax=Portunus trituberculatus TaxID=210409 RepID=A0A5B7DZF7_PORTR|nr:hypothetical protein [Portunus trituberculatus]